MNLELAKSLLITGGTGSFGRAFLKVILKKYHNLKRIIIFSRDEFKQWQMMDEFPQNEYPQIRFFLGDIRDFQRLSLALQGIDIVVHAAALKQVPAAEYNPMEFIKTNVMGADNLVQACLANEVKSLVALSTDKAAAPINLYGASKLCSDKLFIAANNIKGERDIKFSVVRYGNVLGSRGSVIPYFINNAATGKLLITDPSMTRFSISLEEGVNRVIWALNNSMGGEIFVPKLSSYRILDVANAIGPSCKKEYSGIRPGEKISEEMITKADSFYTIDLNDSYVILPSDGKLINKYLDNGFKKVNPDFSYNSTDNEIFLTIDELRSLIKKHVDKNFTPI